MLGRRFEVDVHVIHGNFNRLQNPIRAVKSLQLEVDNIVFNGLASALALLTSEQKETGALVIDLGGGTTEFAVCAQGIVRHTGVLAIGGDHVSNDLAYGLKVPLSRAERLKIDHGAAMMDDAVRGQTVTLGSDMALWAAPSPGAPPPYHVGAARGSLRVDRARVHQAGLLNYLGAGVFLCGGGARIPQVRELAESVFGLPVSLGRANSVSGLKSALDQPEFAAAIGLVRFGSLQTRNRGDRGSLRESLRDRVSQILRVARK